MFGFRVERGAAVPGVINSTVLWRSERGKSVNNAIILLTRFDMERVEHHVDL